MKVGDLVGVKFPDPDRLGRNSGIVLKFDTYHSQHEFCGTTYVTPIVNVLWSSGLGWISKHRIEVIGGNW